MLPWRHLGKKVYISQQTVKQRVEERLKQSDCCIGGALMSLWVILVNIRQSEDLQFLRIHVLFGVGSYT